MTIEKHSAAANKTAVWPTVACDMTNAEDNPAERLTSWRKVLTEALVGKETTISGIRFRFYQSSEIEAEVRRLVALEGECCAFIDFDVSVVGGEVLVDASTSADPTARAILMVFFNLTNSGGESEDSIRNRFAIAGLKFDGQPGSVAISGSCGCGGACGSTAKINQAPNGKTANRTTGLAILGAGLACLACFAPAVLPGLLLLGTGGAIAKFGFSSEGVAATFAVMAAFGLGIVMWRRFRPVTGSNC